MSRVCSWSEEGWGYILHYPCFQQRRLAAQTLHAFSYSPDQLVWLVDVEEVTVQVYLSLFLFFWSHLFKGPDFIRLHITW